MSFLTSLFAATVNAFFGVIIAWVLVRYRFPGRRLLDAFVDLPFALPTAVAGIALTALYAPNGWIGSLLAPLGIKVAYTPTGITIALIFIGLALRGAHRAAGARGVRPRARGGLGHAWRQPAPDRVPRGAADADAGDPDRLRSRSRPRRRRIRLGDLHRRQHALHLRDRAAPHHHQAGGVQLSASRGDRHGDADDLLRHPAVRASRAGLGNGGGSGNERRRNRTAARHRNARPRRHHRTASGARYLDHRWGDLSHSVFAAAAGRGVRRGLPRGARRLFRRHHRARRRCRHQADPARRRHRRAGQRDLRLRRVLGHRQVRVCRQEHAEHADRSSLLGFSGDLRPDLCAAVRRCRAISGHWLQSHDIQIIFAAARHRARHHLRHLPLRRPRARPADAGAGHAGRGGGACRSAPAAGRPSSR